MTKEEALKDIASTIKAWCVERAIGPEDAHAQIATFLDAYAFSVVQESVPEDMVEDPYDYLAQGFNSCRSQTLQKAKEITNQ